MGVLSLLSHELKKKEMQRQAESLNLPKKNPTVGHIPLRVVRETHWADCNLGKEFISDRNVSIFSFSTKIWRQNEVFMKDSR